MYKASNMFSLSFIGSCNFRTYFYLKALKEKNIRLEHLYIYDYKYLNLTSFQNKILRYKDLTLTIDDSLDDILHHFNATIISKLSINDLETEIKVINSDICIFSGKGGEIVNSSILELNKFLHIHPGKLPLYRGSTTIYYSLLRESKCHATAFYLDNKIDTGRVIKQMEFDILDMDFDYLYDPFIRTYLLIDIIKNQTFNAYSQKENNAKEYYIIHPVLKKLALLKKDAFILNKKPSNDEH